MTEKEKMLCRKLYSAQDAELKNDFQKAKRLTRLFNQTTEDELASRTELLQQLFCSVGENSYIEPPFRCDYGCHITIGKHFYANYDCIILDVCRVTIGDHVLFGPRVGIYTAGHPVDAEIRNSGLEYGKPVTIGSNVWVGANVAINPGVTIGNNVIIGSGSVVTKSIPDNVIAAGNPCKVLRAITQEDKIIWEKKRTEVQNE